MVRVALSALVHARRWAAVGLALTTSTLLTSWPQQERVTTAPVTPAPLAIPLGRPQGSTNEIRTF